MSSAHGATFPLAEGSAKVAAPTPSAKPAAKGGLLRQGLWLSVASLAQTALGFGQNIIVSRYYGPGPMMDAMGACNGVVRYATDLLNGVHRAFLQNYVRLGRDESRAEQLFWFSQLVFLVLLAAITVGTWIFRVPLLHLIYPQLPPEAWAEAVTLLPILFLSLTFSVGLNLSNGKATAHKRVAPVALFQVTVIGATLVTTLLCLPVLGLQGILLVKAGAIALASGLLLLILKGKFQISRAAFGDLRTVLHDANWLILMGAVGGAIVFLENWFAARMPEGRLTLISWARQFAFLLAVLLQGGMRQVVSVYFQELMRDDKRLEMRRAVRKILQYGLLAGGACAAGTFFFGRDGLHILFGGSSWQAEEIHQLWKLCCVMSLMVSMSCLGGLLVQVVIATKRFHFCMVIEVAKLACYALGAPLLLRWDIYGLAAAQLLQQTLGTGLVLFFVCHHLHRSPRWRDLQIPGRILAVALPTVLALAVGRFIADSEVPPAVLGLAAAWKRIVIVTLCGCPGLALTVWFGICWEIPPLDKAGAFWRGWARRRNAARS